MNLKVFSPLTILAAVVAAEDVSTVALAVEVEVTEDMAELMSVVAGVESAVSVARLPTFPTQESLAETSTEIWTWVKRRACKFYTCCHSYFVQYLNIPHVAIFFYFTIVLLMHWRALASPFLLQGHVAAE
jgi:hypothetical protein